MIRKLLIILLLPNLLFSSSGWLKDLLQPESALSLMREHLEFAELPGTVPAGVINERQVAELLAADVPLEVKPHFSPYTFDTFAVAVADDASWDPSFMEALKKIDEIVALCIPGAPCSEPVTAYAFCERLCQQRGYPPCAVWWYKAVVQKHLGAVP